MKNKVKVNKTLKNHDRINHIELGSDIENGNIVDCELEVGGRISAEPEAWEIIVNDEDGIYLQSYTYDSREEYLEDVKLVFGE